MKLRPLTFPLLFHHHQPHHIPHPSFSLLFSSTTELTPLHQPLNKPSKSHPNPYIPQFYSLSKTLTQNPRNFKALSQLDSFLSHSQFFDSVTSVTIFEGLCLLKKLNRAKDVFFHLKENLKVSPFFAYSLVFDSLVKDGNLDDVELQWSEMGSGYDLDLSNYVIDVCKCGEFDEIKSVCERVLMGSSVLGRQSYVALIGVLCRYDEGLMAKLVLDEMYFRGFEVDDVTYIVMFQCFCRIGDLDAGDWILRKLVKEGFEVDVCVYGSFMYGLCKMGRFREARKLFEKLVKRDCFSGSKAEVLKERRRVIFQLNYKGVIPEMMVYEMYLRSLCAVGKLDDAEMLLKRMMKKRAVPQVCVYGSFIKALFRAGREEDALKFFNVECKKGHVCPNELARFVIVQLSEKGRVDDALRIFHEFTQKGSFINSVILCNCLLGCLWDVGRITEAERFFEQMHNGDLEPPNLATYRLMVCGFCKQGNIRKALDILEEMLSKHIIVDRFIYEPLITLLSNQGWFAEAYKYLDSMTRSGSRTSYTVWKRMFYLLISDGEKHTKEKN